MIRSISPSWRAAAAMRFAITSASPPSDRIQIARSAPRASASRNPSSTRSGPTLIAITSAPAGFKSLAASSAALLAGSRMNSSRLMNTFSALRLTVRPVGSRICLIQTSIFMGQSFHHDSLSFEGEAARQRVGEGESRPNLHAHLTEQLLRDEDALNLIGAFENFGNARIAEAALHMHVAAVAQRAHRLHGAIDTARSDLRSQQLAHARFLDERLLIVHQPRRAIDQRAQRFDLGGHVGHHELNTLRMRQRLAKLLA